MGAGRINRSVFGCLVTDLGGDEVAAICALFVTDAHERLAAVRSACDAGDADRAARAAHLMKSASGFVGFDRIAELCGEIERLIGENRFDEVRARVDMASDELNQAGAEVVELLGSPPGP